jgi:hypothetical protein
MRKLGRPRRGEQKYGHRHDGESLSKMHSLS